MTAESFDVEWDERAGVLRVELRTEPPEVARFGFRAPVWVSFAAGGRVCAIDVLDVPQHVADAVPPVRGGPHVGRALLDSGWLWIPLTGDRAAGKRTGVADVELRLTLRDLTSVAVRFIGVDEQ